MRHVVSTDEMPGLEACVASVLGTDLAGLMRRAGEALAAVAAEVAPEGRIVVLAGPGNNGGDGWVAARVLHAAGRDVVVRSTRPPVELSPLAASAAAEAIAAGVAWSEPGRAPDARELDEASCVVDAILGTGVSGELREPLPHWIAALNASCAPVVAADVPSGVASDTGAVASEVARADVTVAMLALKPGHVLYPGAAFAGDVILAPLGASADLLAGAAGPELWDADDLRSALPVVAADAHKNSRGRLLVVAGSAAYPGAAVLAVRGAQRAGAGYVTLATPQAAVPVVQAHLVSAPVVGVAQTSGGALSSRALAGLLDLARDYDAVVLGPGLTLADGAAAVAREFAARVQRPLVVDADGLNALVGATGILSSRTWPTVVTPHPGEAARLLETDAAWVSANRLSCSASLARAVDGVAVLKGAPTVVSGEARVAVNTSGGPALATAGTGDVLAGVIGALLAQGAPAYEAAVLGVWLHGRAGDAAAAELTPRSVIAEDVPEHLPAAFAELLGTW